MRLSGFCLLLWALAGAAFLAAGFSPSEARTRPSVASQPPAPSPGRAGPVGVASMSVAPPDAAPSMPVEVAALPDFEPSREDAKLEAFVDGVVAAHRRAAGTPGVAVSVVKDGRVLFAKGYGLADAPANRPADGDATLFRIGSISKTFTWTAVMMLADRGLIDLDADVNGYLKGVEIPPAFGAPITMNHLMSHRAGFEDTLSVFTHADDGAAAMGEALERDMPARVFAPGARTSYSNWASALAAKVVEDVAGVPYETFLREEILAPLGMAAASARGPALMTPVRRARLAAGHKLEAGRALGQDYMQIGPYAPAGVMASSAADMARWMRFHLAGGALDGTRLMSPATHALMLSRRFNDRADAADLAHGFMTQPYRGAILYGHGGATGAFYANMIMAPELGVGVFVAQNAANDRRLVNHLPKLVIDRFLPSAPPAARRMRAEDLTPYAGDYLANRRSFTGFEKLFAAGDLASVSAGDDGLLMVARQGRARAFAPVGDGVFEDQYGDRIAFARNADGRVTHMTGSLGVHSYDRIGGFRHPATLILALGAAGLFSATTALGAWRRYGHGALHGPPTPAGRGLAVFALAAVLVMALFAAAAIAAALDFAATSVHEMVNYPFASVILLQVAAYGVFLAALCGLAGLAPAWKGSGWSVWRKVHYSLFAASLGFLAAMLMVWNVIFAPFA